MPSIYRDVDFGPAYSGLATVGFQVRDNLGVEVIARTTAGVFAVEGGVYGANLTVDDGFVGSIYWDTTDGSTVYASEAIDLGSTAPTAAENAAAIWDEALSGHVDAGSAGEALAAAGTAGDPWIADLPGGYAPGTAGRILGTFTTAGEGPHDVTIRVIDIDTGDPIQLARVDLVMGASRYSRTTNALGIAVLRPNEGNGTYKVRINQENYDPMDEVELEVDGDTAVEYKLSLFVVTPSAPPLVTAIIVAYDTLGIVKPGVTILLQQIGPIPVGFEHGIIFDGSVISAVSGINGVAQFPGRVKGATYRYQTNELTRSPKVDLIPLTAIDGYQLGSLISR